MTTTELYRKPTPPGYLGGYNWRATALGLVSLVVVSFIGTEYIAQRFHFQAALGAPLLRSGRVAVYEPFAWMIWGWEHATASDSPMRRPFFEGEMIVAVGSFLCVGLFYMPQTAARANSPLTLTTCMDQHAGLIPTTLELRAS